jgi:cytochrome oxidase Cu insertion factor (SCO1/SenC/PrrC family)
MGRGIGWGAGLLCIGLTIASAQERRHAAGADPLMPQEGRVLYRLLPDARLQSADGAVQTLAALWRETPLLLVFAFSRCAGVCSPLLLQLKDAAERVGGIGTEYRILVVSFDSADTPEQLAAFARRSGVWQQQGWLFATAEPDALAPLLQTVGFWYSPVTGTDQYDHPAMVLGVRKGRIVRVHVGALIRTMELRAILHELRGDPVLAYPLPTAEMPFRCYGYNPETGAFRLEWGIVLLLAPTLVGAVAVWLTFARQRRRAERCT